MANIGCDVSSEWVDFAVDGRVFRRAREKGALQEALAQFPPNSRIALEPTGRFHRLVAECAGKAGHEVKVVDPYAFSLYRRSLNARANTDKLSALALARFAEKEWERIPEYAPLSKPMQRLRDLLQLRETQVQLRVAMEQALREVQGAPAACKRALAAVERSVKEIELAILALVRHDELYGRLLKMDGVGPATAAALVWLFRAFRFVDADQVVAFVGMDVRVKESGKHKGLRKVSKRGLPLFRHLLCCAASSLRSSSHFKPLFAKHHAKGIRAKGVNVIVARRIVRAAFELAQSGKEYDRLKFYSP